jgi:hypothetical protein
MQLSVLIGLLKAYCTRTHEKNPDSGWMAMDGDEATAAIDGLTEGNRGSS